MIKDCYLGGIFYRILESGDIEKLRVIRFINEKKVEVEMNNTKSKMLLKDILDNYTLLCPDAYMTFSIVRVGNLDDVVVTLILEKDTDNTQTIPWCVCRQNINNIFDEILHPDRKDGVVTSGLSVSQKTIPANMNIIQVLVGDKLISTECVCMYLNDVLDNILKCIRVSNYDKVLKEINEVKLSLVSPVIRNLMKDKESYAGCHKTLVGLLTDKNNDFMYDVRTGFDIHVHDSFTISDKDIVKGDFETGALIIPEKIVLIEKELGRRLKNPMLLQYSKDIDLEEYNNYILVCDMLENIFIVTYEKDEDILSFDVNMTPEDRVKLIMK